MIAKEDGFFGKSFDVTPSDILIFQNDAAEQIWLVGQDLVFRAEKVNVRNEIVEHQRLFVYSLDSRKFIQIGDAEPRGHSVNEFSILNFGKDILIKDSFKSTRLYLASRDGAELRILHDDIEDNYNPYQLNRSEAANSEAVAFMSQKQELFTYDLKTKALVLVDSLGLKRTGYNVLKYGFTADGRIIYLKNTADGIRILSALPDGTAIVELARDPATDYNCDLESGTIGRFACDRSFRYPFDACADGSIVFRMPSGKQEAVFSIASGGGQPKQLTPFETSNHMDLSHYCK